MKELNSHDEVIAALGGTAAVEELTSANSAQSLSNWKARGFPARLYLVMITALRERGCTASAKLWGMEEPRGVAAQESQAVA